MSAFKNEYPKARKEHECWLCTVPIQKGTHYARWGWHGDGSVQTMRAHIVCDKYAKDNLEEYTDEGVGYDAVEEHVRDTTACDNGIFFDDEAEKITAKYPDIAPLVAKIRAGQTTKQTLKGE